MSECSKLFLADNVIFYQGGYNEHSPANLGVGESGVSSTQLALLLLKI